MYCHHCGADEPEIRIGNRTFCSACGLPLGDREEETTNALPAQPEIKRQSELDRAFQSMSGNLGGTGEETSYKSSDMSMVRVKNEEKDATIPKDLTEPISDQPFVQQQTATDIQIDTAVVSPTVANLLTDTAIIDIPKVPDDRIPTEKESAFKKALEEQIKEELKTTGSIPQQEEEMPVNKPETEGKTIKEQVEDELKIAKPKPELKNETSTIEPIADSKSVKTIQEQIKDIEPSEIVKADIKEDLPPEPSEKEGEIKSLGAASKLLDILEKNENFREKKEEKSKLTDTLKGAERLMDILQDIPKIKPVQKNNVISKFFDTNPLAKEKEIASPLDTPEIDLDKDDFEKEEQTIAPKIKEKKSINDQAQEKILGSENIGAKFDKTDHEEDLPDLTKVLENYNYSENEEIPASANDVKITANNDTLGKSEEDLTDLADIFADHKLTDLEAGIEDSKEPESHDFDPKDIKIEAENFDEPNVEKPTDDTPEIPVDPVDVVTDWKNEDEDFENFQNEGDDREDEPANIDKSEPLEDQENNTPAEEDSKDTEKEISGIHGLGDKKGHIDHWPEEEVKKIDTEDSREKNAGEHPLTSYFKEMLEHKTDEKTGKTQKKKKRKKKKNYKSFKIIFAFLISLGIIFGGVFAVSKIPEKDFQTDKDKATQVLNFQFKEPRYLPAGFIGSLPILGDSSSIEIPYTHVTDSSKQIRIKQSSVFLTEDEILEQYVNKNSSDYATETLGESKIYYFDNSAIFVKDKIVIFVNASFEIDKSELKNIAESML